MHAHAHTAASEHDRMLGQCGEDTRVFRSCLLYVDVIVWHCQDRVAMHVMWGMANTLTSQAPLHGNSFHAGTSHLRTLWWQVAETNMSMALARSYTCP